MQRFTLCRWCVLVLACMALAFTLNAQTTKLPISDLLAVQGHTSIYIPPVPDYLGWGQALCQNGGLSCVAAPPYTGLCFGDLASVDYAGVADKFIVSRGGQSSGTTSDGFVQVRQLGNNRAQVTVSLHTKNALTFVLAPTPLIPGTACMSPSDVNFATQPLALGVRAYPVPALAQRALGESTFNVVYEAAASSPLVDLMDLLNNHYSDVVEYLFFAVADGPTPGGGHGTVTVLQGGARNVANLEPAIVYFHQKGK